MKKSDAYWLKVSYIAFAAVIAYTLSRAFNTLGIETGWAERYLELYPILAPIVSIICGIVAAVLLAKDKERHEYFLHSIGEFRKVSWPSFLDVRRMTIIVCIVVGIFAIILAIFDVAWGKILSFLVA